jgi:hypothetical protein
MHGMGIREGSVPTARVSGATAGKCQVPHARIRGVARTSILISKPGKSDFFYQGDHWPLPSIAVAGIGDQYRQYRFQYRWTATHEKPVTSQFVRE